MINIRRIYVYLISAITLQSVTWAVIALLRNLTAGGLADSTSEIALQISMILVGLPLFLVHWLWAQRSAAREQTERATPVRRLYLDAMLFAFILPFLNSGRLLIEIFLLRTVAPGSGLASWTAEFRFSLIAIVITAVMGFYFYYLRKQDDHIVDPEESSILLDQVFLYLLCLVGLGLTAYGAAELLRLLLESIFGEAPGLGQRRAIAGNIALLVAGVPTWIAAWRQAQSNFATGDMWEQSSIVRKIYLYMLLFLSSLTAVTTTTILLANFLLRILDIPSAGGGFFRALSIILISLVIWSYHAHVLRHDAAVAEAAGQAAAVRRIYNYLISAVGLTAVLIGLGGILSVLIRALDGAALRPDLREQLAWFTATLLAGLPLWLVNWRRIQILISGPEPLAKEERTSFVRRFYLYFFVFVAVLTLLGGAVYVVSQLVELALGSRLAGGLLTDMGQALAYTLIAVSVLYYHGTLLRDDQYFIDEQQMKKQRSLNVAVVDVRDGRLGRAVMEDLQRRLPGIIIHPLPLTQTAAKVMNAESGDRSPTEILSVVEVIIAPWQLAAAGAQSDVIDVEIAQAFNQSAAHKLILPFPEKNVTWIGAELGQEKSIVREVGEAVENIAKGEKPSGTRRMSAAAIAVLTLITLCALVTLIPLVIQLIAVLLETPF